MSARLAPLLAGAACGAGRCCGAGRGPARAAGAGFVEAATAAVAAAAAFAALAAAQHLHLVGDDFGAVAIGAGVLVLPCGQAARARPSGAAFSQALY